MQAAAWGENVEIIRLLLDKGADVNAQGGKHGNALQAAAYTGNLEVTRLLLDKGANVNAQGGEYDNALQAAAASWRAEVEVIRLLLDKGADVNAQGGIYGNALQASVSSYRDAEYGAPQSKDKIAITRLLLDKGADVNIQGGMFGTVLQAAAYFGNIKVVRLLLDQGADIDARGGKYGAALKKVLALEPAGAGLKMPGDIPLLLELLQDHAPVLMKNLPESEYENTAKLYASGSNFSLDVFKGLLESRGWKREAQSNKEEESETEREPYQDEGECEDYKDAIEGDIEDKNNKDAIENEIEDGDGTGNKTSQQLQQTLLEALKQRSLEAIVHMWKLFGFISLVFLLYTFIEFWGL